MVKIQTGRGPLDRRLRGRHRRPRTPSAARGQAGERVVVRREGLREAGRLRDSYEWVSTCQGKDAVDDDQNGNFADDYEGNQFPYVTTSPTAATSPVTPQRRARGDRQQGRVSRRPPSTTSWATSKSGLRRRAPSSPVATSASRKGSRLRAHRSFGPGHRSRGIGFAAARRWVAARDGAVSDSRPRGGGARQVGQGLRGGPHRPKRFSGQSSAPPSSRARSPSSASSPVGASRSREMPELATLVEVRQGFQVLAVGVDTSTSATASFGSTAAPPRALLRRRPERQAARTVRRGQRHRLSRRPQRQIRHKQIGFGKTTVEQLKAALNKLL